MSLRAEISTTPSLALVTADDLAKQLSCSPRHVRRLSDRGAMPTPIRLGGLVRWERSAIERWIASGCPVVAHIR